MLLVADLVAPAAHAAAVALPQMIPPAMPKMTPALYPRVIEKREVVTELKVVSEKQGKRYQVFSSLLIRSPMAKVRKELLFFPNYKKLSRFMKRVEYSPGDHMLLMTGGVLSLEFGAILQVNERAENWIHFTGMTEPSQGLPGDLYLKPLNPNETIVYLLGEFRIDETRTPDILVEKASQIVVGATADRIRTLIETGQ